MDNKNDKIKKDKTDCKENKCCKKDDKLAEVVRTEAAQNTEIIQEKKADN